MKRVIIILLAAIGVLPALAQKRIIYFGGGSNLTFTNIDNLNFVVDRYNETRNYLDDEMDNFSLMHGHTIYAGVVNDNGFTSEYGWFNFHQKKDAAGIDGTGQPVKRELKVRYNSFSFLAGYTVQKVPIFKPGLLIGVDLGRLQERTRVAPVADIDDADFEQVDKEFQLGFNFMFSILLASSKSPVGLAIRPYYHVEVFTKDYYKLNSEINPVTYVNDPYELKSRNNFFGLQIALLIAIIE